LTYVRWFKEYFETLGYEAITSEEAGLKIAKNRDIVESAGKYNLILVTQYRKSAELAELLGIKCGYISNLMVPSWLSKKSKNYSFRG
jgi:predicted nuclease of predicted toxin-antitoxin system